LVKKRTKPQARQQRPTRDGKSVPPEAVARMRMRICEFYAETAVRKTELLIEAITVFGSEEAAVAEFAPYENKPLPVQNTANENILLYASMVRAKMKPAQFIRQVLGFERDTAEYENARQKLKLGRKAAMADKREVVPVLVELPDGRTILLFRITEAAPRLGQKTR
jgi:hypothetical protein